MSGHTGAVVGRSPGSTPWRGRLLHVVLASAIVLGVVATPPLAHADDGLHVASRSRYVLDTERSTVAVAITMTLRNVAPNEETGQGVRYYYYDTYGVPLPAEARDVRATSEGRELTVSRRSIDGDGGYRLVEVSFPDLLYPDTRTIELTFTLEGQPPRSADPTRIGAGYATFPVFGPGDPGQQSVEVVVPTGFEVDSTARSFTATESADGTTVHRSEEDNLAPGFAATMSVRGDAVGQERPVTVGGVDLVLVPYPNDPEWADFIEERADVGLPVLVELLGQDWPGDVDRIREDSGSQVRGFEGWYSTSEREIVLGEALEDGILFHELAHAWVNTATVQDRWLSEGLAELLAEETAERTGGTFTTPRTVDLDDGAALPLQTWRSSPSFRGTEVDAWAYPASYQVVAGLLEGMGEDALRRLLHDVVTARSPWDLPGQRLLSGGALGSPAFLDLLASHEAPTAVSGAAEDLYSQWVLEPTAAEMLDDRSEATAAYAAFAETSAWAVPLGIRRAMAQWEFGDAQEQLTERRGLAVAATALEELSRSTATEPPERVRRSYEGADTEAEYAAAGASIAAATNALRDYEAARAAADGVRGPVARLGATVLRIDATAAAARDNVTVGEFAAAQAAADLTVERAGWAARVGLAIVAGAVLLLLALVACVIAIGRRARLRRGAAPAPPGR